MPEPVVFIRGLPPFLEHPGASGGMVDDLKNIASLSDKQIAEIRTHLTEADGFLDPKRLLAVIRKAIEDLELAEAVRRVFRNLAPAGVEQVTKALERDRDDEDFPFEQKTFDRLKQVLSELVQPCPALTRFQKAERLAKVTGQQLESIELICDLRPIFDENREDLEGMMPYTRLHIVATGEDGLPKAFEAELTHQQVLDLVEKAEKAKSKLNVLRQSVETWLPGRLPDLPLTRVPRKESSDE